jgi:hypothetical protein
MRRPHKRCTPAWDHVVVLFAPPSRSIVDPGTASVARRSLT